MSPEQAAQQLAWPVGTVHSRLARGRARLRHRLRHRGLAPDTDNTQSELAAEPAVIPAALVAATRQAATRLAAGELLAGIVSDSVVSLAIEGLRTQMVTKLVITGGATLALGLAVAAAGVLGYEFTAQDGASRQSTQISKAPQRSGKSDSSPEKLPAKSLVEQVTIERAAPNGAAFSLAISPDGRTLAAGCNNSSVRLVDAHGRR